MIIKIFTNTLISIILFLSPSYSFAQLSRNWDYSYNLNGNYESSGNSITVLPSGKTVTGGIYRKGTESNRNALLFVDQAGAFLHIDTSSPGSGYRKVIYDGKGNVFAAATLYNDSLPISKLVVVRFDTTFSVRQLFVPDSGTTFPGYDVVDMAVTNNSNIVVASHWDAFPLICLSLLSMDSSGTELWERVDSSFEFSYDIKILPDSSGGIIAAGSGRDTSTSNDFIFISHYTSAGIRDWSIRNYSSQSFAEMNDFILDNNNIYISATVMDSSGQVGELIKIDSTGNIIWNKSVSQLPYLRLLADNDGNIYGAKVPQNGIDVLRIEKLDSSGALLNSSGFQNTSYFNSELGDIRLLDNGIIAATGGLYVLSFPKSDLFLATFDTSLNLLGVDIFDSLNLLGENGRSITEEVNGNINICGRVNFENQFETCNIGVISYHLPAMSTGIKNSDSQALMIFPNPSTGDITIKLPLTQANKINFRIFNSLGNEVFQDIIKAGDTYLNCILKLTPGMYQAMIQEKNQVFTSRIVVIN